MVNEVEEGNYSWDPQDYDFNPYELTMQATKEEENEAEDKKKSGRSKRLSIVCQVEGCEEELICAKAYYKRYRICPTHCNMESLVIEGQRVRFCQQCGAFHDIRDFAGQRKSCKRKLAQHNERRRKAKGDKMSEEIQFEEQYINDPELLVFQKLRSKSRSSNIGSMEVDHADGISASIKKSTTISRQEDQKSTARNDEVERKSSTNRRDNSLQTKAMSIEGYTGSKDIESRLPFPDAPVSGRNFNEAIRNIGGNKPAEWKEDSPIQQPFALEEGKELPHAELPDHAGPLPSSDNLLQTVQQQFANVPWAFNTLSASSAGNGPLAGYVSRERIVRLSMKLFECYPDDLLPVIKEELNEMLRTGPVGIEGYLRPGCVHLTIDVRLPAANSAERQLDVAETVTSVLNNESMKALNVREMALQYRDKLVVATRDHVVAQLDIASSGELVPEIESIAPLAFATVKGRATLTLSCRKNSFNEDSLILCRQAGRYRVVELPGVKDGSDQESSLQGARNIEKEIGVLGLTPGWAELEVQRGLVLSQPRPCLICPNPQVAAEIRQLEDVEGVQRKGIDSVDGLIRDLGMILVYLHREETQQQGLPTPMYTSQLLECIQAAACRIAVCAVARGWFATLQLLLPATMAFDHSEEAAMIRMNELCPQLLGGNLLHVAVGTGSVETVRVLGEWTRFEKGSPWSIVGRTTAGGVSPLHVAATLPPDAGQRILAEFRKMCPKLDDYWSNTFADDGISPQQLWSIIHMSGYSSPEPIVTIAGTSTKEDEKTGDPLQRPQYLEEEVARSLVKQTADEKITADDSFQSKRAFGVKVLAERKVNNLCRQVEEAETKPHMFGISWVNLLLIETVMCLISVALAALVFH